MEQVQYFAFIPYINANVLAVEIMPKYNTLQRSHQFFTLWPKLSQEKLQYLLQKMTLILAQIGGYAGGGGGRYYSLQKKRLQETRNDPRSSSSRINCCVFELSKTLSYSFFFRQQSERNTVTSELSGDRGSNEFLLRALLFLKRKGKIITMKRTLPHPALI